MKIKLGTKYPSKFDSKFIDPKNKGIKAKKTKEKELEDKIKELEKRLLNIEVSNPNI